MESKIETPVSALKTLIFEYAQARVATIKAYRIHPRLPAGDYWQGRLDALGITLNYVYGLTTEQIESRLDYQQYVLDVDRNTTPDHQ